MDIEFDMYYTIRRVGCQVKLCFQIWILAEETDGRGRIMGDGDVGALGQALYVNDR